MGRPTKYSDKELEDLTQHIIDKIDAHGLYLPEIRRADIVREAKLIYPGFTRDDAEKEPVKKVLREYEKKRKLYIAEKIPQEDLILVKSFNAKKFIFENRIKGETSQIVLYELEEFINKAREVVLKNKQRLDEANTRIIQLMDSNSNFEKYLTKEKQNDKERIKMLEEELEKYKTAFQELDDMAAQIVLKENNLINIRLNENPRARAMTYLSDENIKKERIERLKRGNGNGKE
ncbi:hypothetical protein [Pseudobutyrivibrio sp. LB2011]|uniref:hypothetical protein n=1 Tax=Pseudobutyrivibrio sp. LB2011 TaxID=1408312 RepID=UPI0005D2A875|nr:hypothetical protein [Pseudobutyrivibrio sp. LB2011]